jgi:hypothetical protein
VSPPKLVLTVIDGLKPSALERAVSTGRAPVLGLLMERGTYVDGCVAAFPSVTPACAATIATGHFQDRHRIPSMNWWWRDERRYVEYGSSFGASRKFGINRQLVDTVYRMNMEHLAPETPTVFEALDDAGVRTAGTTYLIYRGRHDHEVSRDSALTRIAGQTLFRRPIKGPRELFYADLYASRRTPCRSQLGMPGIRDQHTGCVGAFLVEHDLFDFLLLSFPDNDTHSHKFGPHAQVQSVHEADRQLERVMHAGGGPDQFLAEHAVVVVADHSHALLPRLLEACLQIDGVDLVMHREEGVAVVMRGDHALAFAPGEEVRDVRGGQWVVRGDLGVLDARVEDGVWRSDTYPDALARAWAALDCPTSGDVLLSAAPGAEFVDWGGADHVGGGSHGSLHNSDSLGALIMTGVDVPERELWSIRDIAPLVLDHFRLPSAR